ncbi:MAG: GntR family transcriptional regulator [Chloroflexota bacterium]|nr:GntR family transcriptional regulator [Chloroflexota bacterium]
MISDDPLDDLGPRSRRVYAALKGRIAAGAIVAGSKLPPHTELATEFGVSPVTMRQVLARLEEEGLVSREQGRGTFVHAPAMPAVLIVEDDPATRILLREHVTQAGYQAVEASGPSEGIAALERNHDIALVLSDVRMPDKEAGIEFIRTVRNRWLELPLAAVTAQADDLAELHGTPECPVLIVPKPIRTRQIDEALRLALRHRIRR